MSKKILSCDCEEYMPGVTKQEKVNETRHVVTYPSYFGVNCLCKMDKRFFHADEVAINLPKKKV